MKTDKILDNFLNEGILYKLLPSGIKCYIIPKKGFVEKQAVFCSRYGSVDNIFYTGGKRYDMPAGMAHFLEHKMFDGENANIIEKFTKLGANVNAFTNFNATAYYFNCIDNFDKNLKLLLDFVSNPHFTDESVEREKSIIGQEIDMYEDDPVWAVYFQMLRNMYNSHPVKENIAGSNDSIQNINKEMLYDCFNAFYHPSNMAVICVGGICAESIFEMVENTIKPKPLGNIIREYGNESFEVQNSLAQCNMHVAAPLFCIGFKDCCYDCISPEKTASAKILIDILAGESSVFFNDTYSSGLIGDNFSFEYSSGANYGNTSFSGISENPEKIFDKMMLAIADLKRSGICENSFERIKKKHIGRFARGFNYIDALASKQVDYFTKGFDILDMFEAYKKVTLNDVKIRINELLNRESAVLSIIN